MGAPALPALGVAALLSGPAGALELDGDWLRGLPSSHDIWSLVETVDPFCIVDRIDGGGLYPGEPGRVGCHGSSWTQASFELDGVELEFEPEAIDAVAEQALDRGTGARGLRAILEEVLQGAMFEVPGGDVSRVVVTREAVLDRVEPAFFPRVREAGAA